MTENTTPADLDELLGTPASSEEQEALFSLNDGGVPAETPEQIRIRELEAKLDAVLASQTAVEEEKTPEQKTLEHSQAIQQTRQLLTSSDDFEEVEPDDDDSIHIHILRSGVTAFGRVWHVGQEIVLSKSGTAYEGTKNRNGVSWLDDLSPATQIKKWKKQRFGIGPWPFEPFHDDIAKEDAARANRAPVVRL